MRTSKIEDAKTYHKQIATRIKTLREALGYTQAELAERSGIARPNIARLESGQHSPMFSTVIRVYAALGLSNPFEDLV